ncbi:hypothetical protein QJS04_geneDACA011000 [Acorus gramineus]|uniref:Protein CHUP1, chloroplastic n=1 Tax=Acorus gramineus TaxID=55184 RepID=A0AAV9BF12_ACOGR|nr:hypothetical protein QJS04_geneDACA011000 [Acorus gramineus]
MVAGKVRAAIGLHRSPSKPKKETTTTTPPPPKQFSSPSSAKLPQKSSSGGGGGSASFSRSFGVYFPRSSSQVQPRPSANVAELLRVVEELRERESRLRTELLEHKILKETVAIVPFLEKEIAFKDEDLAKASLEIDALKAENERLRREIEMLMRKIDDGEAKDLKLKEMETEIENLKKAVSERERSEQKGLLCRDSGEVDDCSSSQRFQGLIDASAKSSLLKNLKRSAKSSDIVANHENRKPESVDLKGEETESSERTQQTRCEAEDLASVVRSRVPRVPKPPPKPTPSPSTSSSSSSSSSSSTSSSDSSGSFEVTKAESATAERLKLSCLPPILPPPPPPPPPPPSSLPRRSVIAVSRGSAGAAPPPPPPPPPKKGSRSNAASVRRVPEVVEFYHSLMRRDSKRDSGAGTEAPAQASAANARNMIGEIENRSAHLLAIKTDVETQGDFIRFLIKEVNEAAFTNIEDVVAFVKWLDDELSFLVDERAVLKHFDWPEHKADAMREAAFGYCDLKKLELEASSFKDDVQRQSCSSALKKMQSLLEKLEHGVYNVSRVREAATKRYRGFQIPSEWMLESGLVSQIKLASVKLAMKYMKRVTAEMEAVESGPEEEELVLQGVRFAFRVHQFAGGFDVETMRAFEELRDKSRSCNSQGQNHHHQH